MKSRSTPALREIFKDLWLFDSNIYAIVDTLYIMFYITNTPSKRQLLQPMNNKNNGHDFKFFKQFIFYSFFV